MKRSVKKLIVISLSMLLAVGLFACGEDPVADAKASLNAGLTAMQKGDFKEASKYISGADNITKSFDSTSGMSAKQTENFCKALFENMTFKIGEGKANDDGNKVTFTVKLKNVDMTTVVKGWLEKAFSIALGNTDKSEKELTKMVLDAFTEQVNEEVKEKNFTEDEMKIDVKNTKDGWMISTDKDQLNSLTGGFVDAASRINQ